MGWADDFDVAAPDGDTDTIDTGDDLLRSDKRAIRERLAWAYGFGAGETADTKLGVWRVPFNVNPSDPAAVADQILLYAKDANSKAELFMRHEDGAVKQLTSAGQWIGSMTKEVKMWFGTIASLPSGVYLCDGSGGRPDLRDKFIICARQDDAGVAKTNVLGSLQTTGGNTTHSHGATTGNTTLTVSQVPALTVSIATRNDSSSAGTDNVLVEGQGPSNDHVVLSTTGGGSFHAHTISADTHLPPFYALAFVSTYNV